MSCLQLQEELHRLKGSKKKIELFSTRLIVKVLAEIAMTVLPVTRETS